MNRQQTLELVAIASPLAAPSSAALAPLGFAQRDSALLTLRHEESFLLRLAQYPLTLYFLAKALEQLLLGFSRFQDYSSQLNSPLSS
jgi:hypothetical protein